MWFKDDEFMNDSAQAFDFSRRYSNGIYGILN